MSTRTISYPVQSEVVRYTGTNKGRNKKNIGQIQDTSVTKADKHDLKGAYKKEKFTSEDGALFQNSTRIEYG